MKVNVIEENEKLVLQISETIDSSSAPELESILKEKLEGKTYVIFDLQNLRYTSSAGLRVLIATHKLMQKKGTMIVRNVGESVAEVLDMTGFSTILNIE